MPTVLVVGIVGGVAALALGALSRSRSSAADPIDPLPAEHWLLHHVPEHSTTHRVLRTVDRRVFGGVATVAALSIVLSTAAIVGWILDSIDRTGGFAAWDERVAQWGVDNATATSTDLLRAVTHGGDTGWLWLLLALAVGLDYTARRSSTVFAFVAAVGIGIAALINALKWIIDRDRPDVDALAGSSGSSFPSGHSAAAAACWSALALLASRHVGPAWRPWLAAAATFITVAVATSRVLLGVHWLTDVIAGVVVGWAWFFLVALVFGGRLQRFGHPADRIP